MANVGWRYESARHALAAKGIETGRRYNLSASMVKSVPTKSWTGGVKLAASMAKKPALPSSVSDALKKGASSSLGGSKSVSESVMKQVQLASAQKAGGSVVKLIPTKVSVSRAAELSRGPIGMANPATVAAKQAGLTTRIVEGPLGQEGQVLVGGKWVDEWGWYRAPKTLPVIPKVISPPRVMPMPLPPRVMPPKVVPPRVMPIEPPRVMPMPLPPRVIPPKTIPRLPDDLRAVPLPARPPKYGVMPVPYVPKGGYARYAVRAM